MLKFSSKLKVSNEEKDYIVKCLPPNWYTDVLEMHPEKDFEIFIRISAKTLDELLDWIQKYQEINNTSYSVETTHKCSGQRLIFKRSYHCQHRTKNKHTYDPMYRKSVKNTNCPAVFTAAIRTIKKRFQGKDKSRAPDINKPCEIRLKLRHNHSTDNHMALKFKKVLPTVQKELIRLYKAGHSPGTARQSIKADIRLNIENCDEILADRSKCPDYSYCHYIYQKTITDNPIQFDNAFLEAKLEEYNNNSAFEACRLTTTSNGYVVCFCPPLVHRIHQSQPTSSEILFLDSFSTCEKNGARVFVPLTQSEFGCLPLGLIIVNNNSTSDILIGFNMLKDMLGCSPQIALTDEHFPDEIIRKVWPGTAKMLCVYHVLQNIFKWVQLTRNDISISDRAVFMKDFYNLVYASTETELLEKFEVAKKNSNKYLNYLKLLQTYWDKRILWAQCYRPDISQFKSNYSEYCLRILREKIFQKIKSFNLIQIVDFAVNKYFKYFEDHLLDIALDRNIRNVFYSKNYLPTQDILINTIQHLGNNIHLVPSNTTNDLFYMVNSNVLSCTCYDGSSNITCNHLKCISTLIYLDYVNKLAKNTTTRKNCYYLVTGDQLDLPDDLEMTADDKTCQNMFEENVVAVETQEIVDMDLYVAARQENIAGCRSSVQKINDKIEELLQNDPENLLPALQIIYSRFRAVSNVSDICTVFSIDDNSK